MTLKGDSETVDQFCRRVHPKLVGSLWLQCGDHELAEEVAQEAFARVWERWNSVSQMGHPDSWAFRVGFNLLSSQFRRRTAERRAIQRRGSQPARGEPDAAEALTVRRAVAELPPRERAAIVLRFFADLPVEAVATVMRCRPGTVKSLTHHAVGHLRGSLNDHLVDDQELAHDA